MSPVAGIRCQVYASTLSYFLIFCCFGCGVFQPTRLRLKIVCLLLDHISQLLGVLARSIELKCQRHLQGHRGVILNGISGTAWNNLPRHRYRTRFLEELNYPLGKLVRRCSPPSIEASIACRQITYITQSGGNLFFSAQPTGPA